MARMITVTSGMSGHFAVLVDDRDGFWEPWDTGIGRYKTKPEAVIEAIDWASSEEIPIDPELIKDHKS